MKVNLPAMPTALKGLATNLSQHKTGIATVSGFLGLAATVALAWKGGAEAAEIKRSLPPDSDRMTVAKALLPVAGPAIGAMAVTGTSFALAIRNESKKAALMASLASGADFLLSSYKDEMQNVIGPDKAKEVADLVAKRTIEKAPLRSHNEIYDTGFGTTLFYDSLSGRYFMSDRNKIDQAKNEYNTDLISGCMWSSVNEWFDRLNLPEIPMGGLLCYTVDRQLAISFSTQWAENGEPCGVIEYDRLPIPYDRACHCN